jgi:N-acetylglutamate synthase-like GNAT family acetyltransferase
MREIKYQIVNNNDNNTIHLIADWYFLEWNIPKQTTIKKIKNFSADSKQFQVLMTLDNIAVATGGLYNHVGLLDKEPKFRIYKNWLALVYTTPENRKKGLGALICDHIQVQSKKLGIKEIYLFTDTAESLYERLGWHQLERLFLSERQVVVMKKSL